MTRKAYDFVCSIGELIDKLSIENIKCHHANMVILKERRKEKPSADVVSQFELNARLAGEQRVRLRDEINRRLAEAVERGKMEYAPEVRTYNLEDKPNA